MQQKKRVRRSFSASLLSLWCRTMGDHCLMGRMSSLSTRYCLFVYQSVYINLYDSSYYIYRLCVLPELTKEKALCNYWIGSLLQIMFGDRKNFPVYHRWIDRYFNTKWISMVSLYLLCVHDIFGLWTSLSPSQQCEETADLQDPARYLKLPFSKASLQPGNNQAIKNSKESFWIQSSLCSTKLTQNGETMFLLAMPKN